MEIQMTSHLRKTGSVRFNDQFECLKPFRMLVQFLRFLRRIDEYVLV